MTREEFLKAEIGTRFWIFSITFGKTGRLINGLIVEVEKFDDRRVKAIKVEKGSSVKPGNLLRFSDYETESVKTREDGVEYWNSVVRNESDRIESKYQKLMKNINSKLL